MAPLTRLTPFLRHWNAGAGEPVALAEKAAGPPIITATLSGAETMAGASGDPARTKTLRGTVVRWVPSSKVTSA